MRTVSERVDSVARGVAQLLQLDDLQEGEPPRSWEDLSPEDRSVSRDIALGIVHIWDGLRS